MWMEEQHPAFHKQLDRGEHPQLDMLHLHTSGSTEETGSGAGQQTPRPTHQGPPWYHLVPFSKDVPSPGNHVSTETCEGQFISKPEEYPTSEHLQI